MATIHLTIVTPEGSFFEGEADRVSVRTTSGDVCILPRHIDYAAALGRGVARITAGGSVREAELSGGMITVAKNDVQILTNCFAWRE